MDNQQALKLLHRYHDATNAGTLDELDDLFVEDFINFAAVRAGQECLLP